MPSNEVIAKPVKCKCCIMSETVWAAFISLFLFYD
uniref:Uncharacterized protein n=1 Tax=Rhizophora mucronata TaxID=61149 RepID=A0A2P2P9F3_RHIMU